MFVSMPSTISSSILRALHGTYRTRNPRLHAHESGRSAIGMASKATYQQEFSDHSGVRPTLFYKIDRSKSYNVSKPASGYILDRLMLKPDLNIDKFF